MPPRRESEGKGRRISARLPADSRTVKSAARAFAIMECFDDQQRRLTVMEIARALKLPQSSTSTLLASLASLGYLDYDPQSRAYRPTVRVALMGSWIGVDFFARGPVLSLMEALGARTGETILLALRNGLYAQYIHVVQATKPTLPHLTLGTARLLTQSGSGLALLALMTDAEALKLVRRIDAEAGRKASVEGKAVLTALATVRAKGYAFTADLVSEGAAVIAMPLPGSEHRPPMALGIGGTSRDLRPREEALAALLAEEIARHLGPGVAAPRPDPSDG